MAMTNEDGDLLLDAIEIERQRNRMMRQAMTFRHAVVDARSGELIAVMRDSEDAYDYCDYLMTIHQDATVLDLWADV
jgi:hypothetical protein